MDLNERKQSHTGQYCKDLEDLRDGNTRLAKALENQTQEASKWYAAFTDQDETFKALQDHARLTMQRSGLPPSERERHMARFYVDSLITIQGKLRASLKSLSKASSDMEDTMNSLSVSLKTVQMEKKLLDTATQTNADASCHPSVTPTNIDNQTILSPCDMDLTNMESDGINDFGRVELPGFEKLQSHSSAVKATLKSVRFKEPTGKASKRTKMAASRIPMRLPLSKKKHEPVRRRCIKSAIVESVFSNTGADDSTPLNPDTSINSEDYFGSFVASVSTKKRKETKARVKKKDQQPKENSSEVDVLVEVKRTECKENLQALSLASPTRTSKSSSVQRDRSPLMFVPPSQETEQRKPRAAAQIASFKEPSVKGKLRQGDKGSSSIYSNLVPQKKIASGKRKKN